MVPAATAFSFPCPVANLHFPCPPASLPANGSLPSHLHSASGHCPDSLLFALVPAKLHSLQHNSFFFFLFSRSSYCHPLPGSPNDLSGHSPSLFQRPTLLAASHETIPATTLPCTWPTATAKPLAQSLPRGHSSAQLSASLPALTLGHPPCTVLGHFPCLCSRLFSLLQPATPPPATIPFSAAIRPAQLPASSHPPLFLLPAQWPVHLQLLSAGPSLLLSAQPVHLQLPAAIIPLHSSRPPPCTTNGQLSCSRCYIPSMFNWFNDD